MGKLMNKQKEIGCSNKHIRIWNLRNSHLYAVKFVACILHTAGKKANSLIYMFKANMS